MSSSGRVALPDVREALPVVREWSGGPPGCPEVTWRPSRMFVSDWETLPAVREWW